MNFARQLRRVSIPPARRRAVIFPSLASPLRIAQTPIPRIFTPQQQVRHGSTVVGSLGGTGGSKTDEAPKQQEPSYELTFTCKPCHRSSTHTISKQGYHYGSVLITCPGCHNRHVISDHLKIFSETSRSFEEILAQSGSGETIKKYTAAQRSYLEQLAAEDTLRARGVWSEGGNHVEVLPEPPPEVPAEEMEEWKKGLEVTPSTRPGAEDAGAEVPGSGDVKAGKEGVMEEGAMEEGVKEMEAEIEGGVEAEKEAEKGKNEEK